MRPRWALLTTLLAVALGAWLLAGLLRPEDGPSVEVGPVEGGPVGGNRPQRRHRGQRSTQPRPVPKEEPRAEPEPDDALVWGARFFDDAVRYVSRGKTPVSEVRSVVLDLEAEAEVHGVKVGGRQRTWVQAPDRIRVELELDTSRTVRILNGESAWLRAPSGRVQDVAGSEEAEAFRTALRRDLGLALRLARLVTLESWKGEGVTFRFEGYTKGTGTYAGDWVKVTRHAPEGPRLTFWLAYARGSGGDVRATWPGIVRIEGDPLNPPTMDYILKDWEDEGHRHPKPYRTPLRVEAYDLLADGTGGTLPTRLLFGVANDLQVNVEIEASVFAEPR